MRGAKTREHLDALVNGARNYWKKHKLPIADRFWAKVEKGKPEDCWDWKAGRTGHNYGIFYINNKIVGAHRVAWAIHNGVDLADIPHDCICHRCDNPPCCNPSHLFSGTHKDNCDDKIQKGRHIRGKKASDLNPRRILTASDVREIRFMYSSGKWSKDQLAEEFGVTRYNISHVVYRQSWKHVP